MLGKRYQGDAITNGRWDLVVIGGGITGAGIALAAARLGQRTLLLEQQDFSWGTSSRSSKMVHGGLRYLAQGDIRLTRHSLQERERLLKELPELVVRKTYLFPIRQGAFPGRWAMTAVLWLYDMLAGVRDHSWLPLKALRRRLPKLKLDGVRGAMSYTDALTDDCRLVLRTLHEAVAAGACLANYSRVDKVSNTSPNTPNNSKFSIQVTDVVNNETYTFGASKVVNATGAFADRLSAATARVRPLRGTHLFFDAERLPIHDCLTLLHPADQRPIFVFPWQGVTCVGTTDIDHKQSLDNEAVASAEEVNYLLTLLRAEFPDYELCATDILSCMAGVRPIIASGHGLDPSKERRDHAIWIEDGIISVSGGKLTTFRLIALDVMQAAGWLTPQQRKRAQRQKAPLFRETLPFALGSPLQPQPVDTQLEARIAWMLDNEMVIHLDDLMLRRTRIGLLVRAGGRELLPRIEPLCRRKLGWDTTRWQQEVDRYLEIIARYYQPDMSQPDMSQPSTSQPDTGQTDAGQPAGAERPERAHP